ncbi:hypothetical protein Hjap01_03823 [Haloarcula japonica]|uniref:Uncharacterized protein n=1 Tax=Haloarcula sebkhae TaxID=932660 RepID=A0A830EVJ3_9EURY|nr:hypothetical protein GCM10009067_33820 [Haloarcula sebkhae]
MRDLPGSNRLLKSGYRGHPPDNPLSQRYRISNLEACSQDTIGQQVTDTQPRVGEGPEMAIEKRDYSVVGTVDNRREPINDVWTVICYDW